MLHEALERSATFDNGHRTVPRHRSATESSEIMQNLTP
jgi:hypothetical protein